MVMVLVLVLIGNLHLVPSLVMRRDTDPIRSLQQTNEKYDARYNITPPPPSPILAIESDCTALRRHPVDWPGKVNATSSLMTFGSSDQTQENPGNSPPFDSKCCLQSITPDNSLTSPRTPSSSSRPGLAHYPAPPGQGYPDSTSESSAPHSH
jgi:hypothetical protein